MDYGLKCKILKYKHLEKKKKTGEHLEDLGLGTTFFDLTPKA